MDVCSILSIHTAKVFVLYLNIIGIMLLRIISQIDDLKLSCAGHLPWAIQSVIECIQTRSHIKCSDCHSRFPIHSIQDMIMHHIAVCLMHLTLITRKR